MRDFFFVAASLVLALVAIGLVRILRGPENADRMMAGQLLGSGSIAVLLLAAGGGLPGAADVALTLALLASFVAVAFVQCEASRPAADDEPEREQ
jgi:multicomponent Na+:H+ antiporter subunit F